MGKKAITPRPSLLDVIEIDGRLAQVCPGTDSIIFLDEKARLGKRVEAYRINWDNYDFNRQGEKRAFVADLRDKNEISKEEFMAIHWGPEQRENPDLRDYVTFFGRYELRNR